MCIFLFGHCNIQTHDLCFMYMNYNVVILYLVVLCVCVCVYIPAIVDRHRDFYMQTWPFVNRGRPRILEEVH